jgi:transcriptional regulator with XRE-family HTH domain
MYYPHTKEMAKRMREKGISLGDISKKLNVTKSTLSFWCKDIVLTESAIKKIKTKGRTKSIRGLLRYSESKRKERMERNVLQKQEGVEILGTLLNRDILMIGLGLYWGEGYKYENGELGFTNSNPYMIRFYFKWLELWNVKKDSLIFRLTINEFFRKEEEDIKNFWVSFLGIKEEQFSKTTFIQTNLKKASLKNVEKYRGILRVKVRRGTSLRNKILGAIEHISDI